MDAPIFSKIELTGTLTTRYLRPIILFDDDSYWFAVGLPWGAWSLLGKRVRAEGNLLGMDKIDVVRLEEHVAPKLHRK